MTFTEASTVKAHLRDLIAGAASVCPAQLSHSLVRMGDRIADFGWKHVAPDHPRFPSVRFSSATDRRGQMQ